MANKTQVVTLTMDIRAKIDQAQSAIAKLANSTKNVQFGSNAGKQFQNSIELLQNKISKLSDDALKDFKTPEAMKGFIKDIDGAQRELGDLVSTWNMMKKSPGDFFTTDIAKNTQNADALLKKYIADREKVNKLLLEQQKAESNIQAIESGNYRTRTKDTIRADIKRVQNNSALTAAEKETQIGQLNKELEATLYIKGDASDVQRVLQENKNKIDSTKAQIRIALEDEGKLQSEIDKVISEINKTGEVKIGNFGDISKMGLDDIVAKWDQIKTTAENTNNVQLTQMVTEVDGAIQGLSQSASAFDEVKSKATVGYNALADTKRAEKSVQSLTSRLEYFFSMANGFRLMERVIRSAFNTVKELDAAMTETAVVTDYTVADMWGKLDEYTARAKQLGATTQGAYETATLYYQQGLNDQEAAELSTETMKMARIAGMEYAETTDAMTAALRGFNLELNAASAQRVNDVYSELAAKTASDTAEISTAMEKTASLAHNAGMDLETTAVYLSQAIETTREAPENIGTAMKTILARFQSLTKDPDTLTQDVQEVLDGETVDANNVEAALRKAGVALRDETGQFRDAKDVMLELNAVWDGLDKNTQRYIATQTAGARQQSRFIAMMQDYDRTMELMGYAQNSAGASQKQFDKTLESVQAKLNTLKDVWQEFTMGIANNALIKAGIDGLTHIIDLLNKITGIGGPFFSTITKSLLAIGGFKVAGNIVAKFSQIMGGSFDASTLSLTNFVNIVGRLVGNFKDIFRNDFIKTIEQLGGKISKYFSNLKGSFDLGALTSGLNSTEIQALDKEGLLNTQAIKLYKEARSEELAIDEAIITTKGRLAEAEDLEITKQAEETLASQAETLATQENTLITQENTLASNTNTGSVVANTGAENINTGSVLANTKARLENIAAFLAQHPLIIAIGAAAMVSAALIIKATTAESKAIEKANNKLEHSQEVAKNAQSAYTSLADGINQLEEYSDGFNGLVKGSLEWTQQLIKNNEAVLNLINSYKELMPYVITNSNGIMSIDERGLKLLQQEQLNILSMTQGIEAYNQAKVNKLEQLRDLNNQRKEENVSLINPKPADELKAQNYKLQAKGIQETFEVASTNSIALATDHKYNDAVNKILAERQESYKEEAEKELEINKKYTQDEIELYAKYNNLKYKNRTLSGKYKFEKEDGTTENIEASKVEDYIESIRSFDKVSSQADVIAKSFDIGNANLVKSFNEYNRNDTILSDLLSENGEIDQNLISKLNTSDDELFKLVDNIFKNSSDDKVAEMLATYLNTDKNTVLKDIDGYKQKLVDLLGDSVDNLITIQQQTNEDLATLMLKSYKGLSFSEFNVLNDNEKDKSKKYIENTIKQLSNEQREYLTTTGNQIYEALGPEATSAYIQSITDIWNNIGEEENQFTEGSVKELQEWYSNLDPSNVIQFSHAIKEGLDSNNKTIQEFSKNLQESGTLAIGAGEKMQYLVENTDFAKLTEDLEDFNDENGKITAEGVRELAKSNEDLNILLQDERLSTQAVADVFNAWTNQSINDLSQITDGVISLINGFGHLDDVIASALDKVENFDPGIDEGSFADTYQDWVEKINSFWDNGEYGNTQFQNYLKEIFGQDNWDQVMEDFDGNLEKVEKHFRDRAQKFKDGDFSSAWGDLTSGKYNKNLQEQGLDVSYEGDSIKLVSKGQDTLQMNTEQTVAALQEAYDVSETTAEAMLADFKNYSSNLATELGQADIVTSVEDLANKKQTWGSGENQFQTGAAITSKDLDTTRAVTKEKYAGDSKGELEYWQELASAIDKDAAKLTNVDDIIEKLKSNGNILDLGFDDKGNIKKIDTLKEKLDELAQAGGQTDFLSGFKLNDGSIDVTNAISQIESLGVQFEDAWSYIHEATGKDGTVTINGETFDIDEKGIKDKVEEALTFEADSSQYAGMANAIANALSNVKVNVKTDNISSQVSGQIEQGAQVKPEVHIDNSAISGEIKSAIKQADGTKVKVNPYLSQSSITVTGNGTATVGIRLAAKGQNLAGSAANGTKRGRLGPNGNGGLTLTGELGPELVWEPDSNISYITGASGPEMRDLPGNAVVWPADQTKKIMASAANGKNVFGSTALGYDHRKGSTTKSSNSDDKKNKKKDKADDKLYGTLSRIYTLELKLNKALEKREKLLDEYDEFSEGWATTFKDINNYIKNIVKVNQDIISKSLRVIKSKSKLRKDELTKAAGENGVKKSSILKYFKNGQLNQSKYNALAFKGTKSKSEQNLLKAVEAYAKGLEDVDKTVQEARDNIEEANKLMRDQLRQAATDLDDALHQVKDALIDQAQRQIDKLSATNEAINNSNEKLINSINKSIEKQRQDRENKKEEDDLESKRAKLAALKRDTSGANAVAIKQLEKEIAEQEESYTDTLIDQKISALEEQNEEAREQRERQINILQSILDFESESGAFWPQAQKILNDALKNESFNSKDSPIWKLLSATTLYGESTFAIKESIMSINKAINESKDSQIQNTEKGTKITSGTKVHKVNEKGDSISDEFTIGSGTWTKASTYSEQLKSGNKGEFKTDKYTYHNAYLNDQGQLVYESMTKNKSTTKGSSKTKTKKTSKQTAASAYKKAIDTAHAKKTVTAATLKDAFEKGKAANKSKAAVARALATGDGKGGITWAEIVVAAKKLGYSEKTIRTWSPKSSALTKALKKYATGGRVDYTGPAWLDGTPSKPEMVLNPKDTENFIQLKDILRDVMNNSSTINNGGDNYYDINIQVDQLANDYDVEKLTKKIKKEIIKDSNYRNVNTVRRMK